MAWFKAVMRGLAWKATGRKRRNMQLPIYLDYHATTPCDERVVQAMLPYFSHDFGNPSSGLHRYGHRAAQAVERAREQVADLLGVFPEEVIFTSGATESNNLAIFGLAGLRAGKRRRVVTTAIEHKSVLEPCRALIERGYDVVVLPVTEHGVVDLAAAEKAITDDTLFITVQAANNEIGTIQPVEALSARAHEKGALVHCDAAQAVGKIPLNPMKLGIDFLSISGHKLYGPKGIGALYIRHGLRTRLSPLLHGGGQENGLRPGTLNVPAIVGFGEACELAHKLMEYEAKRIATLRDRLEDLLTAAIPGLRINAKQSQRLPGNSSVTFPVVEAETLLQHLPQLALSTGSACQSGTLEPSHVLLAIGLSYEQARSTIRFGLGRFTTNEEVKLAAELIIAAWQSLSGYQQQNL